jgi:hypothetical protein
MSTTTHIRKWQIALRLARLSTPQLLANARHYVDSMTGNPYFPSPTPDLASIAAQITVLNDAYVLSLERTIGTVAAMHVQRDILCLKLKSLAAYVEHVANADPVNGSTIIQKAGMPEKRHMTRAPKVFSATIGTVKGQVILDSKAVKGGVYIYQISTSNGVQKKWDTIITSSSVRHKLMGLTSSTTYFFRVGVVDRGLPQNWSPVLQVSVN